MNFLETAPLLLQGTCMTLKMMVFSALMSFSLGFIFGTLTCDRLKKPLSSAIEGMTFVLRAVPFYVQLLIIYFVLPDLFHFNLEPFPASVIALGLCSSGYVAQIIRGGINAIPLSQWESAYCLGYSTIQTIIHVIFPQLVRNILPTLNNEIESLLKSTAIASSIGMLELTRMGMNIVSREMQPVPIYLTIALFYVVMSALLNVMSKTLEKRLGYAQN